MNNKSVPFIATHPGELLRDELLERGLSQKQLSQKTGIKASVISETIHGKRSVSTNMAVAFEKVLGIPADFWMNLQMQYNLDSAGISKRDSSQETVTVAIPSRDKKLFKELAQRFGWTCII